MKKEIINNIIENLDNIQIVAKNTDFSFTITLLLNEVRDNLTGLLLLKD